MTNIVKEISKEKEIDVENQAFEEGLIQIVNDCISEVRYLKETVNNIQKDFPIKFDKKICTFNVNMRLEHLSCFASELIRVISETRQILKRKGKISND